MRNAINAGRYLGAREFALLAEAALTPMQAIAVATVQAARNFGLEQEIGSLAAGKVADLIAVDGDPLADVRVLERVDFVMKSGPVANQRGQILAAENWHTDPFAFP